MKTDQVFKAEGLNDLEENNSKRKWGVEMKWKLRWIV